MIWKRGRACKQTCANRLSPARFPRRGGASRRAQGYCMKPSQMAPQLAGKLQAGLVLVPPAIMATAERVPPLPGK